MKAIILGATGAVGRDLTALLLQDATFDKVEIFVRREPDFTNPKLTIHVVDFDRFDEWKHLVEGDVAFSCLGTTLKAAGSKEAQYQVDYTYQYAFAQAAAQNGIPTYLLVSSVMADAHSRVFYTRMKGELEEAVRKLPFARVCILRPPALIRKHTDRITERISLPIIKFFNKIGLFRNQTPMPTLTVAKAMLLLAKAKGKSVVVDGQDIRNYASV